MSYAMEQVARAVRLEASRRKRVTANLARLGFALDAAEAAELSSEDLARRALQPLGLPLGGDPVEALDFYLAGLQRDGTEHSRTGAADAADVPADNAIARFFRQLEE